MNTLSRRRPDLGRPRVSRLIAQLDRAFPEASISGYQRLIKAMTNDLGDRHVLAAAVKARVDIVVTFNVRHFTRAACQPYGIEVQTPDAFLCDLWAAHEDEMLEVVRLQASDLAHPPIDPNALLVILEGFVPEFVRCLRMHAPN